MSVSHELWCDLSVHCYGHGADGGGGGWPGLDQVVLVRITRRYLKEPNTPPKIEDHYYLTSLDPSSPTGSPQTLLRLVREHWHIENRLHHPKDRSYGEDANRTKPGAVVFCGLRNAAVALMPYIPGAWAPQKALAAAAKPSIAVRLLRAKCLTRCRCEL